MGLNKLRSSIPHSAFCILHCVIVGCAVDRMGRRDESRRAAAPGESPGGAARRQGGNQFASPTASAPGRRCTSRSRRGLTATSAISSRSASKATTAKTPPYRYETPLPALTAKQDYVAVAYVRPRGGADATSPSASSAPMVSPSPAGLPSPRRPTSSRSNPISRFTSRLGRGLAASMAADAEQDDKEGTTAFGYVEYCSRHAGSLVRLRCGGCARC